MNNEIIIQLEIFELSQMKYNSSGQKIKMSAQLQKHEKKLGWVKGNQNMKYEF